MDRRLQEKSDELKAQIKFQRHTTSLHKKRADGYKQTIKHLQVTLEQEHAKYQTLEQEVTKALP